MKKIAVKVFFMLLILSLVTPVLAQENTATEPKSFVPGKLTTVQLGNSSSAEIVNFISMPRANGNTVAVSVKYVNNGSSELNLYDYWLRLKSSGNAKFSVKLVPDDAEVNKIPAKTSKVLTYYSNVSSNLNLSDLSVEFIKWDWSKSNFENILSTVKVTKNDHYNVPANNKYTLETLGIPVETQVKSSLVSKSEKFYTATIKFDIKNIGNRELKLAGLQYYIATSDGIIYRLEAAEGEEITLAPRTNKELTLRGTIPAEFSNTKWKLLVSSMLSNNELLPVSSYDLPEASVEVGTGVKKEYFFTNLNGVYYVKVNSIIRTPMDDQDIISANVSITNKSDKPLPLPDLAGEFKLDDVISNEAVVVQPNKVLTIQPNSSINFNMYTLVPYTYEFSEIGLIFQQKGQSNDKETVLEIKGESQFDSIRKIAATNKYTISNVGNASEYVVRSIKSYHALTSKIVTAQVDVTNIEKRSADLIDLVAYFLTADERVYPAEISEIKEKLLPNGKAVLDVIARVPAQYNAEEAVLVLGEAVASPSAENTPSTALSYINPVEFVLPKEQVEQDDLKNINLYPFNISFEKIRSQIVYGQDTVVIDFNYQLDTDAFVLANTENKKIVLEIKDEKNNISFTKEYELGKSSGENSGFELGSHQGRFTATDPDLVFKIQTMNNDFKFNVYEQIAPGHKKLMATKSIRWFSTSN